MVDAPSFVNCHLVSPTGLPDEGSNGRTYNSARSVSVDRYAIQRPSGEIRPPNVKYSSRDNSVAWRVAASPPVKDTTRMTPPDSKIRNLPSGVMSLRFTG